MNEVECNFKSEGRGYCLLKRNMVMNNSYCVGEDCILQKILNKDFCRYRKEG